LRLIKTKLHSPIPYFLLAVLAGLVPVLNNKYQAAFFPALSPGVIEILSVFAGIAASALGFARLWVKLVQRDGARGLVRGAAEGRILSGPQTPNEVVNAGRIVSRLVRNADEDLREINPDFTLSSLDRLEHYLPELMMEIQSEEDARIRLGVVGIYLGETLCRCFGWQWFFRADPSMNQFSYTASVIRLGGRELDPFAWASDLLTGKHRLSDLLKEIK